MYDSGRAYERLCNETRFETEVKATWLPIKNSIVSIKISPTNLVFELVIRKDFYSQTRLVGLI